jgi:hypothetical protein
MSSIDVTASRPVLGELSRLPSVERLELVPFDRDELVEQLTAILGRLPDDEVIEEIATVRRATRSTPRSCWRPPNGPMGRCLRRLRDILANSLAQAARDRQGGAADRCGSVP